MEIKIVKEMEYKSYPCREVLAYVKYKDLKGVAYSCGYHPCAYIGVNENHPFYQMDYNVVDEYCNIGLTFGQEVFFCQLRKDDWTELGAGIWWFGWDYAHAGDWLGYYDDLKNKMPGNLKKYSTQDIVDDIKNYIKKIDDVAIEEYMRDLKKKREEIHRKLSIIKSYLN